jgi:hypothetical protein
MTTITRVDATYIGQRITTKGALAYFWLFHDINKEQGYKKQLVWATIGEAWNFGRAENGAVYRSGEHKPINLGIKHPENALRWESEHQSALHYHAERKAAAKLKARQSEFDRALEPIRRLLDAAPSHIERGALIQRLCIELWRRTS